MREDLDDLDDRQVDILDVFVTKLVINCVNFRKTFCVFTGGTSGC